MESYLRNVGLVIWNSSLPTIVGSCASSFVCISIVHLFAKSLLHTMFERKYINYEKLEKISFEKSEKISEDKIIAYVDVPLKVYCIKEGGIFIIAGVTSCLFAKTLQILAPSYSMTLALPFLITGIVISTLSTLNLMYSAYKMGPLYWKMLSDEQIKVKSIDISQIKEVNDSKAVFLNDFSLLRVYSFPKKRFI